jgi:hypothetical protein
MARNMTANNFLADGSQREFSPSGQSRARAAVVISLSGLQRVLIGIL